MRNICDTLIPQVTNSARATGVLTSADTGAFANGKVVVIGDQTYTFKTTLSTGPKVAYEVLIGVDGDGCLDNLVAAVNGTGTIGTDYSEGTEVNTEVTASAVASNAVTFTAIEDGFAGNSIVTTTDETKLSWGAATLVEGVGGDLEGVAVGGDTATLYTEKMEVGGYEELINFLNISGHSGTTPTLDVTQQISPDGDTWTDGDAFAQVTTTDAQIIKRTTAIFGKWVRFKLVLGGTAPRYTIKLSSVGKA